MQPYCQPVQYRHHQNLGTVRSRDTRSEHGEIRSHGVPDRIGRQRQTGHDQILRKYDLDRSRSLQRLHGPDQATVPTGVGTIGESTFEECTALAALTLPSSVKTIGDKAFKSCAALADADLAR